MAITKLKQVGDWGVIREQLARLPRPVGRPRIIVGLLTGDDIAAIGEAATEPQARTSGKQSR